MISSLPVVKMPLAVKIMLALVAILLLANILSPLRLNTDAIRYFNIMLYLKGMLPPTDYAGSDFLPHGYPLLLKYLDKAGLLNSKAMIAINILAGVTVGYLICRLLPAKNRLIVTALLLLSYINIKHLILPIPDELFAGSLLLATWCWAKALKDKWIYCLPAFLITAAAIYLRTAGIVIPCGIVLFLIYTNWPAIKKNKYLLTALIGVVLTAIALFLYRLKGLEQRNDYFRYLNLEGIVHGPNNLSARVLLHLQEMGELLLNIPCSKLNTFVPHPLAFLIMPLIIATGLFMFALTVYIIIRTELYRHLILWVYLCYMTIIIIWPFYDTRFLIPIIPLFIYCLYTAFERCRPLWALKLLATVYVLMGLFALSYSTAISINQSVFLKLYGFDKEMTASYRQHFEDKRSGTVVVYDINKQRVLYILNAYDK
ncbi:hypothetical protein HQ865_03020 [Mucilaginibacter mali]|uniref:Glycosyltransferase RgtA/B/C/D-like domain-containing protein n=1 Tax=Mucilaginibacter mali TaxID=2740462 RepID=A0A7D4QDE1_9SPHI|nr:hypothetical protein [Mucilaginibacter mali]QKJ28772.1 hypothetical protein HQ865_03020 [Mucilaginibacter mali]